MAPRLSRVSPYPAIRPHPACQPERLERVFRPGCKYTILSTCYGSLTCSEFLHMTSLKTSESLVATSVARFGAGLRVLEELNALNKSEKFSEGIDACRHQ